MIYLCTRNKNKTSLTLKKSRAMTTISNATAKQLQNKVNEWSKMTDNNEHSGLLCDMAYFFEMGDDIIMYFFKLDCKEYLTLQECNERYEKSEEMLAAIKTKHGEKVYNTILKAF